VHLTRDVGINQAHTSDKNVGDTRLGSFRIALFDSVFANQLVKLTSGFYSFKQ
jgi:hypothetical protein